MAPRDGNNPRSSTSSMLFTILPYVALIIIMWRQNETMVTMSKNQQSSDTSSSSSSTSSFQEQQQRRQGWDPANPLAIPQGEAVALPSIRVEESSIDKQRKFYGGAGDKAHLGGFTELDTDGISPNVWKNMIKEYGVRSLLDVGCGRGISSSWFLYHGARIKCAEGSHDAVERTLLPDPATQVTEHDFSRGPWWPKETYDAVWAVEFLEHVGVNYHFNYITAFRKAALIFVTSSRWGGWHHVEVHMDDWWIKKYESYGFRYSPELSQQVKNWAQSENNIGPDGKKFRAQHIRMSMKVFLNPVVAALPEHAHLFPEMGCFVNTAKDGRPVQRECGTAGKQKDLESKLPDSFKPLELTDEMDKKWMDMLRDKVNLTQIA